MALPQSVAPLGPRVGRRSVLWLLLLASHLLGGCVLQPGRAYDLSQFHKDAVLLRTAPMAMARGD